MPITSPNYGAITDVNGIVCTCSFEMYQTNIFIHVIVYYNKTIKIKWFYWNSIPFTFICIFVIIGDKKSTNLLQFNWNYATYGLHKHTKNIIGMLYQAGIILVIFG